MVAAKYFLETFLLGPEIYACYQLGSFAIESMQFWSHPYGTSPTNGKYTVISCCR